MRATGIVRRVDDLGRIVIPREVRKQVDIIEGEPMEIYIMEDGSILLKKYKISLDNE
jgi:AbrB family looped-hinge helix DNA binding protein